MLILRFLLLLRQFVLPSGKTWPLVAFEANTEVFEEDELNDNNSRFQLNAKYLILI